ncbi:efflux RND transporter periplasmic adaptor subunit [Marinobacter sp. 71-i]|uniref:Efflux RND transporter periplasmic adaptor subunit n=1 Tax=Marinobacter iranensis TaxID=2962607 RepID=A0ABT5Y7E4_9GAMM|nr:efflux RND transporter periplasmic adaptor subunit [Marinobacter iranensis]MDF0749501.1 efflux RND transporter periplasmic adaptor subunit [Marinobacter iranensis]
MTKGRLQHRNTKLSWRVSAGKLYRKATGVFAMLLVVGCSPAHEAPDAPSAPRLVDVATVQLARSVSRVTLPGRIRPNQETTLSFEVPGQVEHLGLEVGDTFQQGDTLARLDGGRYRLAYERSQAAEEEARIGLADAQRELQRLIALRQGGHTSQATLDNAEAAVAGARARVNSAVASRKLARRDLKQTSLQAPFSGTVARRSAEPGQRVTANQVVLGLVSSDGGFDVLTHVPENLIGRIQPQSQQTVTVPALDAAQATARVQHIGTSASSANQYPVILRVTGPVPGLRSGMTAEITFEMAAADNAATPAGAFQVPLTSLVYPANSKPQVLRLDDANQLRPVTVTVHSVENGVAVVTGEFRVGERIVARGVEFVSVGERVSVLGQGPQRLH